MSSAGGRATLSAWRHVRRERHGTRGVSASRRRSTGASRRSSSTGTAPPFPTARQTRRSSARLVEALCAHGMDLGVVTGTHVGNVDSQLRARPAGPGRLYLCMNRGSEVFTADEDGLRLLTRREATRRGGRRARRRRRGDRRAPRRTGASGGDRLPTAEPPQDRPDPRARVGGSAEGSHRAICLPRSSLVWMRPASEASTKPSSSPQAAASEAGLPDPRVTSDAKHVEIGLTDKADSARWLFHELGRRGVGPGLVLVAGDEFGPLGGLPGSDSFLLVPEARAFDCGLGRRGADRRPRGVIALGGGPAAFARAARGSARAPDARRPAGDRRRPALDARVGRVRPAARARPRLAASRSPTAGSGRATASCSLARPRSTTAEGPETALAALPGLAAARSGRPSDRSAPRRRLDLRAGLLERGASLRRRSLRAVFLPRSHGRAPSAVRAEGDDSLLAHGSTLLPPGPAPPELGTDGGALWIRDRASTGGGVVAASGNGGPRAGAWSASPPIAPTRSPRRPSAMRCGRSARSSDAGFERLLGEHRAAWAARWESADVVVDGDAELQLAVRFALFHLMALRRRVDGEAAVGARGLTGTATAATCSGTATSSSCRSSPRRTRRPRARCSSTGSAG